MAGNVATLEGFNDLADWGADSVRVGIGGGSICLYKNTDWSWNAYITINFRLFSF